MGEVWSGVVGIRRSDATVAEHIVRRWHQCALQRCCIAPEGSNKTNHRQDQTALSVLVLSQPLIRNRSALMSRSACLA